VWQWLEMGTGDQEQHTAPFYVEKNICHIGVHVWEKNYDYLWVCQYVASLVVKKLMLANTVPSSLLWLQ
jgi:hypothetical protein